MNKAQQYFLFHVDRYDPHGGINDLHAIYDNIDSAKSDGEILQQTSIRPSDVHIFDIETGDYIVLDTYRNKWFVEGKK